MNGAIITLVIAVVFGAAVATSHAQEKLKAASTPPAGVLKEMPLAGSDAARRAEAPAVQSGDMPRVGQPSVETGVAQPDTLTDEKAKKE
jgi:hypothetical protein